ncbi:glycosyltransferase [Maribacter sp. HTCC2170]|uniref:glycosyltransferase n=1 Tax=Maribacter sp. (strain HTCC2170 / KCCM 42371) TaxID=313603 RepID=UPI00006B490B|nr:glycosyltransferase [Maribacter sp. HTCC2170]EAR01087.1 wlae protein [Maribacter sp. HTCC2170]
MSDKAKKNKLAIFIYSFSNGGAERVMSYLLPYLKKKGREVVLVLMNDKLGYVIPEDVPVYYIEKSKGDEPGIFKFLKLPWLAWKYARLLKRLHITHSFSLLTRSCYINIMARWFTKHSFKLMVSERNYPSLQYGYGDMQGKVNTFLVKKLYPRADLVISNAKASEEDLVQNFNVDPTKTKVIYNPIDLKKINAISPIDNFFDPSFFNTISVGRLEKVKNQKLLIHAVKSLDNVRLYILGDGELRQELEKEITLNGLEERVFLMGFETNPYKYLKGADLFIFGSNHEGFPNVLLEAMSCGLPILTTNCKSGPDEIMELNDQQDNEIMVTPYGILAPVENSHLLQKGLHHFMQNHDYLRSCKENVLNRVKVFDKETILNAYEMTLLVENTK